MAEIKVSRVNEGVLLSGSLPSELSGSPSLEIFPLRDGLYLLSIKGGLQEAISHPSSPLAAKTGEGAIPEKEKEVVRKLLSIRFEKRTPAEVANALSPSEKQTLEALMKRKLVHIFHGGKYEKDGVYNVSDFAFNAVREPQLAQPPSSGAPSSPSPISSPEHLEKNGWMVLESEMDAKNFAGAFPGKIKSGEVMGVRAFDMKYYFVKRQFYENYESLVQSALLKSEKTSEELAEELGLAAEGCRALLFHLCENGEAMEKHRGKFSKA